MLKVWGLGSGFRVQGLQGHHSKVLTVGLGVYYQYFQYLGFGVVILSLKGHLGTLSNGRFIWA